MLASIVGTASWPRLPTSRASRHEAPRVDDTDKCERERAVAIVDEEAELQGDVRPLSVLASGRASRLTGGSGFSEKTAKNKSMTVQLY